MTMNPTVKQQWINKLRDGTVQQAASTLEDETGAMCCLGVLCAVQGYPPALYFSNEAGYDDVEYDSISDELMTSTVPHQFAAGLVQDEMDILAVMNDGGWYNPTPGALLHEAKKDGTAQEFKKHTFAEIADYIEENL